MASSRLPNGPAYGLYDQVIEIERWFHEEKPSISALQNYNTPLVIVGPEGSGRTTLLFQWIQFHEAKWLELADQKKRQQTTSKCKIILIIDGIDRLELEDNNFVNHTSSQLSLNQINYKFEEEPPDWMPRCFPLEFRVIFTCKQNSKSYQHFKNMKIPFRFLHLPNVTDKTQHDVIESYFNTISASYSLEDITNIKQQIYKHIEKNQELFRNHLYLYTFLNILCPYGINLKLHKIQEIIINDLADKGTVEELFKHALKHYETKFLPRSKFRKISCILALSKSGLKKDELKDCLEVKGETIDLYMKIFNFSMLEYRQLYKINNELYKKTIERLYLQEELFKNEIHSSIVTILSKVKHFNSNARLIEEVTYNIYKQGNQWLKLKDLLSNLEIFCHLYKPADKYQLAMYWQKLEQHGFDPVYEYNKTVEAFVLNYFPTPSELFVILTQFSRFFKELGDLETKCTPEFRHPPLVISPELGNIKLDKELESIGGMLTEMKNNVTAVKEEEKFNVDNPLFMQVFREKQVQQLSKENPLFPSLQLYYYKRWIWLQFPWFCMDIYSSFSAYMCKTMGKSINLHMNTKSEMDLVQGSLRIIKEAKSRKQLSGKQQIYQVPIEFAQEEDEFHSNQNDDKTSSSDESINSNSKGNQTSKQANVPQRAGFHQRNQSAPGSPLNFQTSTQEPGHNNNYLTQSSSMHGTIEKAKQEGKTRFLLVQSQSQSRLQTAGVMNKRNSMMFGESKQTGYETLSGIYTARRSQYSLAKAKWIDQDYELANLKSKIKPENAVRVVSNQVKNYERKELQTVIQINRELINEVNRIAFEIQQKERVYQSLQNCILQLDNNNKETQVFEKKLQQIQDKLDSTKTQYKIARKEQNRLKHIVNYCFKNKADNHEWINGLELAVNNMVTLIKHEKESIINSKNIVLELKKSSKELLKLKQEKKFLQGKTTDVMYGMINEKQTIKGMREEFERRRDAIRNHEDPEFEQSHFKSVMSDNQSMQRTPRKHEVQSKLENFFRKSIHDKLLSSSNTKNKTKASYSLSNQIDGAISIPTDEGMSKEQVLNLINKLEQIRLIAGAQEIQDIQPLIDFLNNHHQLIKERDYKEAKVFELRNQKQQLLQELQNYHNAEIDIANSKYQPKKLQNNFQHDIVQAQLERNLRKNIFKKSFDLFLSARVLIEEMRKKLKMDNSTFNKDHILITGEELVQGLFEVQEEVEYKKRLIEDLFGGSDYDETMAKISQIDPNDLRMKLVLIRSRSRHNSLIQNDQQAEIQEKLKTHDGTIPYNEDLLNEKLGIKVSFSTSHKKPKNSENMLYFGEKATITGIMIEDIDDQKSATKAELNKQGLNKMVSRRSSKYNNMNQDQLKGAVTSRIVSTSQKQRRDLIYSNTKTSGDERLYTQSMFSQGRSQKEKEVAFFGKTNNEDKEFDIMSQNYQGYIKKQENSIDDDSYQLIEQERIRLKSRCQMKVSDQQSNEKKKFSFFPKTKSTDRLIKQHQDKQIQKQHHYYDDEDQGSTERQEHHHNQDYHNNDVEQTSASKTQRFSRKNIPLLDAYLKDESEKLPTYAKQILNQNHKDLIKRLKLMNNNLQKLDKDDLFKKLMAQTERSERNVKKNQRFAHQNL